MGLEQGTTRTMAEGGEGGQEFLPEKPIPLGRVSEELWQAIFQALAPHTLGPYIRFQQDGCCRYWTLGGIIWVEISTEPLLDIGVCTPQATNLKIVTAASGAAEGMEVFLTDAHLQRLNVCNGIVVFSNSKGEGLSINREGKLIVDAE